MNIPVEDMELRTYSDASSNVSSSLFYLHTGILIVLHVSDKSHNYFHSFDRSSSNQHRLSHSSYVSDIFSFADGGDMGFHIKQVILLSSEK